MAEIVLARVKGASPERLVVLKRLHRHLAADRDYVQMFMDEAKLATTLRHSNVVEVYELGEDNEHFYLVMEYLHGHDLRRVLSEMAKRSVSIRLAHALTIISGVCRGLDYTHERTNAAGELLSIVHRDVSPHNVLLTYNGGVKLLDFGIAKTSTQMAKTRTGILKGKVAYMSPEQAMGEELDRRSDVFCIGILLWEMTTGQWLYRRKSELETLKAVVESDAPLPSQVHPGYPRELEQIVMKTLARKREDRWATAGQLADAIGEFATRQRLNLAPVMLGRMMTSLFSEDVAAWQDARRAGATLGDHLVAELEREERQATVGAKRPGDQSGDRLAAAEGGLVNTAFSSKRITVDDFDSPTVDHSPEELYQPDKPEKAEKGERGEKGEKADPELEDEPTTVHTPQRASQWMPPGTAPQRPSPPPGERPPPPDPVQRRRGKPTRMVPAMPPPSGTAAPVTTQKTRTLMQRWKDSMREPAHGRWLWLAGAGLLALLAAVWLLITLLRSDAPPADPNAPANGSAVVPANNSEQFPPRHHDWRDPPENAPPHPVVAPPVDASPAATTPSAAAGATPPTTPPTIHGGAPATGDVRSDTPTRSRPKQGAAKAPHAKDTSADTKGGETPPAADEAASAASGEAPAAKPANEGAAKSQEAPDPASPPKPSP